METVKQYNRLLREAAKSSILGGLQIQPDKALSNLVWIQRWHCFEPKVGLETSWGPFQPKGLGDSMSPANV